MNLDIGRPGRGHREPEYSAYVSFFARYEAPWEVIVESRVSQDVGPTCSLFCDFESRFGEGKRKKSLG